MSIDFNMWHAISSTLNKNALLVEDGKSLDNNDIDDFDK